MDGAAAKKRSKPKKRVRKSRTEDSTPPPPPHFRRNKKKNKNNKNKNKNNTSGVEQPIPQQSGTTHGSTAQPQVDLTGDETQPPITFGLPANVDNAQFPDTAPQPTQTQNQQTVSAQPQPRPVQHSDPRPDFSNRDTAPEHKGGGDNKQPEPTRVKLSKLCGTDSFMLLCTVCL